MRNIYTNFIVLTMLFLAACTTIEKKHGAELRPASVDKINANSTKEDVREVLGSPSTKSTFGGDTWYYKSNQSERRIFSEDEMLEQNTLAISFDSNGVINNVELYSLEDAKDFSFSERITPTSGHDLTVFEQILGNVGKFSGEGLPGGRR